MKALLALAAVIALLALSGCTGQDIRPQARNLPEIKALVDEYPSAYMEALFMGKDAVKLVIDDMSEECGRQMEIQPYWYVTVKVDRAVTEFYVDEAVTRVLCVVEPESGPGAHGECGSIAECNDGDPATKDECKGRPKKCVNTAITTCSSGDGYCPEGCSYGRDRDCPAVDQCQSALDCSDSNNFTKDECKGTPKECKYSLKSCDELHGYLCEEYEVCKGSSMPVSDKKVCCSTLCDKTESCKGVSCPEEQKCVRGNCFDKTCAERKLPLCVSGEECTETYFKDSLGITCCTGECRQPCASGAECGLGEVCSSGYCVAESCSDIGGKKCDNKTERCAGEIERTMDEDECCLECVLKRCAERNGIVCDASEGEECSDDTVETLDEAECCLEECVVDTCFEKPCVVNKKCVEGACVLKTCDEMGGIECAPEDNCASDVFKTEDAEECHVLKFCEEIDGVECAAGKLCSGDSYKTRDIGECCTGSCKAG